jgi:hypothetical protein
MQWAVLAFGIVAILYFVVIRPMRKGKSQRDPLERKPTKSSLAQQRAIERDMGNLLVQYEEMIRRMTAQLDIRATKLELLIREAEEKIAQLKALTSAISPAGPSTGTGPAPSSGSTGSPQAGSTGSPWPGQTPAGDSGANPAAVGEPGAIAPVAAASQAGPAEVPASQDGAAGPALEARKPADEAGPAGQIDDRHVEIYRRADGGRTARQIAQDLDRPVNEVELILHLRSPRPRQGDLWEQPAAAAPADAMPGQVEGFNPPEPPPPGSADQRRKGRKKQRSGGT